jgi:hypothetical protein
MLRARRSACADLALALLAVVLCTPPPAAAAPAARRSARTTGHTEHRGGQTRHKKDNRRGGERRVIAVNGGSMTLTFTSRAWSKLAAGSASGPPTPQTSTTPIAPATASANVFRFPIIGGSLNSRSGRGTVTASGGISIVSGGTNPYFASSASGSVNDPVAAIGATSTVAVTSENFSPPAVTLLRLGAGHVKRSARGNEVTISGIPASVALAGQQFFGIAAGFNVGEALGTLTIRATG